MLRFCTFPVSLLMNEYLDGIARKIWSFSSRESVALDDADTTYLQAIL